MSTEPTLRDRIIAHMGELPGDIYYRYAAMRMLLNEALEIWERQLHEANADDSVWIEGPEYIIGVRDWIDKAKRAPQGGGTMSLDKAIEHGKEKRKPYRGAKAVDKSCRNHGDCPWCKKKIKHKWVRQAPLEDE